MTEALASRVAGLKLCAIVGVLLLPMLVLSFFMMNSLRQDLNFSRRELLGVELNRLVLPVAIAAAGGNVGEAPLQALRKEGAVLAAALDLKRPFSGALADLLTYNADQRFTVGSLAKLQIEGATAANIGLDPVAETDHLGSLFSQQGPALLTDYVHLWTLQSRSLKDGDISREETTAMLLAVGAWKESVNRAQSNIAAARQASDDPAFYDRSSTLLASIAKRPTRVAAIIAKSSGKDMQTLLSQATEFGDGSAQIIADVQQLWSLSAGRFEALLHNRISAMQMQLYTFLAIAAAACLIGVGGAALMFRSTLKQLDDVKLSRDQAEAARRDAESAASDVQRINEEVVRLNSDLARNLAKLNEAQEDSLKKSKLAQLGQLTATVAHELRNPLGAVRTSAFLLARKVKDKGLGIESQIERINNGVTRCDNIISQLLDFARSKAIQPEMVNLDDWLTKLIEEEAQKLPAAVAIECHLGVGRSEVAFDPARMSRVLINLISNASEALVGKGDDPAKFAARAPAITITTAFTGRGAEVTVADNGPGIPAEHIAKIFEPLFTTKSFGTGLGLPAVQKIMDQHGGGLDVASATGQGTAFTAWWPIASELKEAV